MKVPHDPYGELSQVKEVDELPQRCVAPSDGKEHTVILGHVALVDDSQDGVIALDAEVVMGHVDDGVQAFNQVAVPAASCCTLSP